jgi:hypothetical protein
VAYGPRGGAIAWGPGGWAGYSGNIYTNWGNRATVSRVAGGYNAWTGNAWATRVGTSYNSRTGIASAGQRSAVRNVYTGNYAYGGRGVAAGPNGGVVAGGKITVGNSGTGNEATARRGAAYNPNTGEVTTYGTISGEKGTVARVGDDVYAGHDGNVYRRTESGWEQHTPGGGWAPVTGAGQEPNRNPGGGNQVQQLDRDRQARDLGAQRSQALRASSMNMNRSFRGGGGFRGGRR